MKIHPAAELFPMMSGDELRAMASDIKAYGQNEPCCTLNGSLLDGRNRLKACEMAGVEPIFHELPDDTDPWKYVLTANLHRRHLTPSQRGIVAGKIANMGVGRPRKEIVQNCTISKNEDNGSNPPENDGNEGGMTLDDAAESLDVSRRTVATAKSVIAGAAPELVAAVEAGDVTLGLAKKLIDECPDKRKQAELAGKGKDAIKEFVEVPSDAKPSPKSDPHAIIRKCQKEIDIVMRTVDDLHMAKKNLKQRKAIFAALDDLRTLVFDW